MKKFLLIVSIISAAFGVDDSFASLISYDGSGEALVYSTSQDLTYVGNVDLFRVQSEGYSGPYVSLVDEIIDKVGSIQGVHLVADHFRPASGTMRWYGAMAWVQWLNMQHYAGGTAWRLWHADPSCGGRPASGVQDCPNGELGYLYFVEGGLVGTTYATSRPELGQGWTADPPGVLPRYFSGLSLSAGFWAENKADAYANTRWMINHGGQQLAYNYTSPSISNFFYAWPVQEGPLGSEVPIFRDGFDGLTSEGCAQFGCEGNE